MKITIVTKRELSNGMDLKTLLSQISAEYVTPDGIGAYCLPADSRFGLTPEGKRVARLSPNSDTTIIFE
jgi:hypothetical protein